MLKSKNLLSTRTALSALLFVIFTFFAPSLSKSLKGGELSAEDFKNIGEGVVGIITLLVSLHADDKTTYTPNGFPGRSRKEDVEVESSEF